MIITFCGHSDYISSTKDEARLLDLIKNVAHGAQVDFYLGGYGKFDSFALRCAKKYKAQHPNANLVFITPYLDERHKKEKLKEYDAILYPDLEFVPKKFAICKRNEWMIRQADYVFAYVCTRTGGAYKTLLYAHKHNKPYTNLYQGEYALF